MSSQHLDHLKSTLDRLGRRLRAYPPATGEQLAAAEQNLGCPAPKELRDVLRLTRGFDEYQELDLTGLLPTVSLYKLHPHALHLWEDGFGTAFIYDVGGPPHDPGRILFSCHDPPATIFLTTSPAEFAAWAMQCTAEEPSPLSELDTWLQAFCDAGPGAIIERGKVHVLDFGQRSTARLPADSLPGDGFWWAASGSDFACRRLGPELIFEVWREAEW